MYTKQYVFCEEIRNECHITEYHMTLSRGCGSKTCSDYFLNVFTILKLQSMVFQSKAAREKSEPVKHHIIHGHFHRYFASIWMTNWPYKKNWKSNAIVNLRNYRISILLIRLGDSNAASAFFPKILGPGVFSLRLRLPLWDLFDEKKALNQNITILK